MGHASSRSLIKNISCFFNKILKSNSDVGGEDIASPYKKDYDDPVLEYFETPLGNYYLPNNDALAKAQKTPVLILVTY